MKPDADPAEPLAPRFFLAMFCPFVAGYFISFFFRYVNAVISADLTREFALSAPQLAFLTSAYFLFFALAQLPLGLALDRFGPRRVVGSLMTLTAAGSLVFGLADGFATLTLGRALVGLGVSGCLMGALKAFRTWVPSGRLATVIGVYVMIGGLGALGATSPVEALLGPVGWRGVFYLCSALSLAVAIAIFVVVPESSRGRSSEGFAELVAGFGTVFGSWSFWRLVLPLIAVAAPYTALQGLWFGPWLRDVAGFSRGEAASLLLASAFVYFLSTGVLGVISDRMAALGISQAAVFRGGAVIALAILLLLAVGGELSPRTLVLSYAFAIATTSLAIPELAKAYSAELAGRASTAQNMLAFLSVFVYQWAFGVLLGLFPVLDGRYAAGGYRAALLACAALHALSLLCFLPARARARTKPA
jgi:predicted MFS family arabinose efflux permease